MSMSLVGVGANILQPSVWLDEMKNQIIISPENIYNNITSLNKFGIEYENRSINVT